MTKKKTLLQPYRGTKDYYPADLRRLQYITTVWREACIAYGYEEYQGPQVEHRELYTQKKASGDEIANQQLYWMTDLGGREIAIRPEMTPTVSRMIGARIDSLPKPVKWFSIANFMRYERPQRGRVREFWQLNIDSFGVKSTDIDSELIEVAIFMMDLFGATSEMFEIRINNRKWFNHYVREVLGVEANLQPVSRVIDNLEKNSTEENAAKLQELGLAADVIEKLLQLPTQTIETVRTYADTNDGAKELVELIDMLTERGFGEYIQYDGALVRGFDYYTGNVFEQFDKHPDNNRSMFGGGRYDELVGLYSGKEVPANGYAPGNLTTELFLDNWDLWPEFESETDVLVTVFNPELRENSWELAAILRENGLNVELYAGASEAISSQLGYADKKGIPMVAILGPEEVANDTFVWKSMISGEQEVVSLDEVLEYIVSKDESEHDEHDHESDTEEA